DRPSDIFILDENHSDETAKKQIDNPASQPTGRLGYWPMAPPIATADDNQTQSHTYTLVGVIQPPGGQSADIFGRRAADSVSSILGGGASVDATGSQTPQLQSSNVSVKDGQSDAASQSSSRASSVIDGMPSLPILQAESQARLACDIGKGGVALSNSGPKNSPKRTIATIRRNPITGEVYEYPSKQ
ncbi:hypothetical protein GZH46_00884, partial [Fragariocoptes setiger]